MNTLYVKAMLGGALFAIWPMFMNKSGLTGNVSAAMFAVCAFVGVLPFALSGNGFSIPTANWTMVFAAGGIGALGLLAFNGALSSATEQNVGTLIVVTTIAQVSVAALYQTVMSGHLSVEKAIGYVAAALAAYLLLR